MIFLTAKNTREDPAALLFIWFRLCVEGRSCSRGSRLTSSPGFLTLLLLSSIIRRSIFLHVFVEFATRSTSSQGWYSEPGSSAFFGLASSNFEAQVQALFRTGFSLVLRLDSVQAKHRHFFFFFRPSSDRRSIFLHVFVELATRSTSSQGWYSQPLNPFWILQWTFCYYCVLNILPCAIFGHFCYLTSRKRT